MASAQHLDSALLSVFLFFLAYAFAHPINEACNGGSVSLLPCMPILQTQQQTEAAAVTPPAECCAHLQSSITSNLPCLCDLLQSGTNEPGIVINQALVQQLPSLCGIEYDVSSNCHEGSSATPSVPASATTYAPPALPVVHHDPPPQSTFGLNTVFSASNRLAVSASSLVVFCAIGFMLVK